MIKWTRNSHDQQAADTIYAAIVAQARQPEFYRDAGVPDTLDGRFEMLVMHAFLYFRRMKSEGAGVRKLTQLVFDTMFQDLDQNLRELGVGDMSIGKKVRKMGAAFYGRTEAYDEAMSRNGEDPGSLASAIERNIFADQGNPAGARMLAQYMMVCADCMTRQDAEGLVSGRVEFPAPEFSHPAETAKPDA